MPETYASHSQMIEAYEKAGIVYRLAWSLDKSMAMTFGYWDRETHSLAQAHLNLYRFLAEKSNIGPQERVLDAGCAAGGGAIFLAQQVGCQVTGITLSPTQVKMAKAYSQKKGTEKHTEFMVADYTSTPFPDNSFDVVWAVESLFHAPEKVKFVREAARLLRPGGRLVIADYNLNVYTFNSLQSAWLQDWFTGFSIPNLCTADQLKEWLSGNGFGKITCTDISEKVLPSSKRLYTLGKWGYLVWKIVGWLPFANRLPLQKAQLKGTMGQYLALSDKAWAYRIFVAEKG